jgi:hypothetical protein
MSVVICENESGLRGVGSTAGGLTRSSDSTREGLAVKATRCSATDCADPTYKRDRCYRHHTVDRFTAFVLVDAVTGCWLWQGHITKHGYGHFGMIRPDGTWGPRRAHRVAYELFVGPIPEGLTLDHLCEVRHCVNPEHLTPVTVAANTLRNDSPPSENARQERCLRDHPLSGDNLQLVNTSGGVKRRCKACARERRRSR